MLLAITWIVYLPLQRGKYAEPDVLCVYEGKVNAQGCLGLVLLDGRGNGFTPKVVQVTLDVDGKLALQTLALFWHDTREGEKLTQSIHQ